MTDPKTAGSENDRPRFLTLGQLTDEEFRSLIASLEPSPSDVAKFRAENGLGPE